ncbi:DMT family transporter [Lutimaribacter marinistellae]|uniref:DMT family transporter n=1 Tax=Lutimaribacter marinistellae TaxID=1820329 RepID=A0ABV7TE37_9RHOB
MIWLLTGAIVLGGALIAAQGPIYARMAGLLGPVQTAMLAFGLGAAALAFVLVATGGPLPRRTAIASVPAWAWAGGLIGVYVVLVSIAAVPRLGVSRYMVFVIVGQLAAGAAYDHWGAFGMVPRDLSAANLAGLGLVALGAGLVMWR